MSLLIVLFHFEGCQSLDSIEPIDTGFVFVPDTLRFGSVSQGDTILVRRDLNLNLTQNDWESLRLLKISIGDQFSKEFSRLDSPYLSVRLGYVNTFEDGYYDLVVEYFTNNPDSIASYSNRPSKVVRATLLIVNSYLYGGNLESVEWVDANRIRLKWEPTEAFFFESYTVEHRVGEVFETVAEIKDKSQSQTLIAYSPDTNVVGSINTHFRVTYSDGKETIESNEMPLRNQKSFVFGYEIADGQVFSNGVDTIFVTDEDYPSVNVYQFSDSNAEYVYHHGFDNWSDVAFTGTSSSIIGTYRDDITQDKFGIVNIDMETNELKYTDIDFYIFPYSLKAEADYVSFEYSGSFDNFLNKYYAIFDAKQNDWVLSRILFDYQPTFHKYNGNEFVVYKGPIDSRSLFGYEIIDGDLNELYEFSIRVDALDMDGSEIAILNGLESKIHLLDSRNGDEVTFYNLGNSGEVYFYDIYFENNILVIWGFYQTPNAQYRSVIKRIDTESNVISTYYSYDTVIGVDVLENQSLLMFFRTNEQISLYQIIG